MLGKRSRRRPRQMRLDWIMTEGHKKLKEEAQRVAWRRQTFEPAYIEGRETKTNIGITVTFQWVCMVTILSRTI